MGSDTPYICATCGVQFGPGDGPPTSCRICEDERQYVDWDGQRWTTLEKMRTGTTTSSSSSSRTYIVSRRSPRSRSVVM
jgi:hypothetical protein